MEETIIKSIDEIKPFLQRDGGDIEYLGTTEDNFVKVKLQGACSGCPGATVTLKAIVERIIREAVPEVNGVIAVD
ncbi:MAG: NifU family protein [Clostridia bacterium]|nr:NifU family protein [Clostridia bacterium]